MANVYEFLANGFEEIEGLAPVDILRRGGVDIKTVSITGSEFVETSHGVTVKADLKFEDVADFNDADILLLPGGMPGSTNLNAHEGVKAALKKQFEAGKRVGAICAAPTGELIQEDGNVITGEGPAATLPYAYKILSYFIGEDAVKDLETKMQFTHLMTR